MKGKTAIVTGAASECGIGFAIARALGRQGANLIIADLGSDRDDLSIPDIYQVHGTLFELEKRATELRSEGVDVEAVAVDVTVAADIDRCVRLAEHRFGGVDILCNNAGVVVGAGPFLNTTDAEWGLQFKVNVLGAANFSRLVIPMMRSQGGGAIVNTSSNWAARVRDRASIYGATKGALVNLTRSIALEHGKEGIRCNAILPGPILTNLNGARAKRMARQHGITEDEARREMAVRIALGRVGTPDEVAAAAVFLASEAASYVTGVALTVDGGDFDGI